MKRPQLQVQDEVRYLKTAAAMADAGEIRNLVEYIWKGESMDELQENLMQKVRRGRFRTLPLAHDH